MPQNADDLRDAQPWEPITDKLALKVLGKCIEELGEGVSALARTIIQGVLEAEPVTGVINRDWVQNEMADIRANIILVEELLKLDPQAMITRMEKKLAHLRQWHKL